MGQDFINGDAAGGVEDEVIMLPIVIVVEVGFIGDLFLVFVGCINYLMAGWLMGVTGRRMRSLLNSSVKDVRAW